MKNSYMAAVLLSVLCLPGTSPGQTEEVDRWQARVGLGLMFINSGNNLNPKSSKAYLNDLNSAAEKELSARLLILPAVSYDPGDTGGLTLYLNTDPPIDEAGGFGLNLGGAYPFPGAGTLDVSGFFTPFEEAWKNPYATGVDRQATDTSKYGLKVGFNGIMGTGLRINLVYLNDDVDEDEIGSIMPELARDGAVYALNANYSFYFSKFFELRPRLSIRKGDYDGEANSFTKYKVDLEARYTTLAGKLTIRPRIFYSHSEYDEINPIFESTREDDGYGASLFLHYTAPFDWQNWSAQGLLNYSQGDSNITFYDTESVSGGIMLSYHF